MRNLKIIVLLLAVVTALIVTVSVNYTSIQIDINTNPPYSLSSHTVKYGIYESGNIEVSDQNRMDLLDELQRIIEENDLVFISDNVDNMGLGIYDPSEYYLEHVASPYPFGKAKSNDIMLAEESFYNRDTNDTNSVESLGGQLLNVIGLYDTENPLYSLDKEYIYSYFYEPAMGGMFYISHVNPLILNEAFINEIIPAYEKANYIIQTELKYDLEPKDVFLTMSRNSIYMMAMAILVFVFINLLLFYINSLNRLSKLIKIHVLFGATRARVIGTISKKLLPAIISGSFMGVFCYWLIFGTTRLEADIMIMLISFFINIIVSLILLSVSGIVSFKLCVQKGGFK